MYRQIFQSTVIKLREDTVGMKPKAASKHVRKSLNSAANAPEIPKIIIKLHMLEDHIPLTFFSLFKVAMMH